MLSFILFDEETLSDEHYKEALMNNVTIGITKESIEEYYKHYYKLDPLYNKINVQNQETNTSDLLSTTNFETTEYFIEFYDKYGQYYQASVGLEFEGKIIGVLTFIKPHEKGDFLKRDYDGIQKIKQLVTHELIKSLRYENVYLENHALKESMKDFPVAQLILDHDYNVTYYNREAIAYVDALIGAKPMGFKYFFINDLIITGLIDDSLEENVINYNEFTIIVSRKTYTPSLNEPNKQPYFNVYLFKKDLDPHRQFEGNKYFNLLTLREKEIATLIRKGLSNDEIAAELIISPHTVKKHIQRIFVKCEVSSRIQLIHLLVQE